jgi:predicted Holliday junction resolvase-like endonuclease
MSSEFLAIILMIAILGVVTIAWRIRAESDKNNVGPVRKSGLSEAAKRRQMQATIDRLDRKQAETSRKLDQVLAAKSKTVKKAAPKTTKARKTTSKPKTKTKKK